MIYIEAPAIYKPRDGDTSLFLAGGISDCPGWQFELTKMLQDTDLVVVNPRRIDFPMDDPDAAAQQIEWEYRHQRKASAILFWFPPQTLCPITLYELGAWSMTNKPLFVGVHPDYKRRRDVEIQTGLARPEVEVMYSLADLVAQVMDWIKGSKGI